MRKIESKSQLQILLKWTCDNILNSAAVGFVIESKCIIINSPSPRHCPMGMGKSLDALDEKFR